MNKNIKLGISPICWSNDDLPNLGANISFEQCISEMQNAGFGATEIGSKFPTNDDINLKKILDERGVLVVNQWYNYRLCDMPFDIVRSQFISHIKRLHYFGAKVVGGAEVSNAIITQPKGIGSKKPIFTAKDWKNLGRGLNELGKIAINEYDMHIAYHHHIGTGVENQNEIEQLLDGTDDRYVGLNYDSGHCFLAWDDPTESYISYNSRIKHIHLKDVDSDIMDKIYLEDECFLDAVKSNVFVMPGKGAINFDNLAREIKKSKFDGYIIVEAEGDKSEKNTLEEAIDVMKYLHHIFD